MGSNSSGSDFWLSIQTSGDYDRLKTLLRSRLYECGWADQVTALCIKTVQQDNINSVNQLISEVAPKTRALVPDSVKKEVLTKVKNLLLQHAGFYEKEP